MLTQGKTKPNQTTPTAHTNPTVACGGLPSNPWKLSLLLEGFITLLIDLLFNRKREKNFPGRNFLFLDGLIFFWENSDISLAILKGITGNMNLVVPCTQTAELYPSSLKVGAKNTLSLQFSLCWSQAFQEKEG